MDSLLILGISFLIACAVAYAVLTKFFVKSDKRIHNFLVGVLIFFPSLGVTYLLIATVSMMFGANK